MVLGLTNLTWVTAGFGWITVVAPILVAAPLYFSGKVSFGGLMMAAAAFTQAQSSLRWFVDNFSVIADWRATLLRVAGLRQVLASDLEAEAEAAASPMPRANPEPWRSKRSRSAPGPATIGWTPRISSCNAGQRLLILGAPGTEKTLLFRALAGLWPWGSGTVRRPRGETIHYMPRGTPYLPRGTLAEALSYAMEPSGYPKEAMVAALASVGLQRLEPLLDKTGRWERELSMDEQLRLGFARVVLQAPRWLVMDEAFGAFNDDTVELIIDVLTAKLAHTGIIHIGSAGEAHDRLFTQVVHLVKAPDAAPRRGLAAMSLLTRRVLMLLVLALPAWAWAQDFGFRPPRDPDDAAAVEVMRDLAQRIVPVYQEADTDVFLANMTALQIVSGAYRAADDSNRSLRSASEASRSTAWSSARSSTASMRVRARSKRTSASASPRPTRARSRSWCRSSTTRKPRPSWRGSRPRWRCTGSRCGKPSIAGAREAASRRPTPWRSCAPGSRTSRVAASVGCCPS